MSLLPFRLRRGLWRNLRRWHLLFVDVAEDGDVLAQKILVEPADNRLQALNAVPRLAAAREFVRLAREPHHGRGTLHELECAEELFASGAPDRFDRVRWERQPDWGGPHLVDDAHAVAHCRLTRTLNIGDHVVAFGEVFRLWQRAGQNPLLYGQRRYSAWR